MSLARQQLGFLQRASGDLPRPRWPRCKRAVALQARTTPTAVALLGVYLNEAGTPREAERLLAPYAARREPDLDVLIAHGSGAGRARAAAQDALAAFEHARDASTRRTRMAPRQHRAPCT